MACVPSQDSLRIIYSYLPIKDILSCSTVTREWHMAYINVYLEYINIYNKIINTPICMHTVASIGTDEIVSTYIFSFEPTLVNIVKRDPRNGSCVLITYPIEYYTTFSALAGESLQDIIMGHRGFISYSYKRISLMWSYTPMGIVTTVGCDKCENVIKFKGIQYIDALGDLIKYVFSNKLLLKPMITKISCYCQPHFLYYVTGH